MLHNIQILSHTYPGNVYSSILQKNINTIIDSQAQKDKLLPLSIKLSKIHSGQIPQMHRQNSSDFVRKPSEFFAIWMNIGSGKVSKWAIPWVTLK